LTYKKKSKNIYQYFIYTLLNNVGTTYKLYDKQLSVLMFCEYL